MAAGMAAEGLSPLAENAGADVGEREVPSYRLPGHPLLFRAEEAGLGSEEP